MTTDAGYSRTETATHIRKAHSTYGWIMEKLIEEAGFRFLSAEYERSVYADDIAVMS
jgi:hypothetical protein